MKADRGDEQDQRDCDPDAVAAEPGWVGHAILWREIAIRPERRGDRYAALRTVRPMLVAGTWCIT